MRDAECRLGLHDHGLRRYAAGPEHRQFVRHHGVCNVTEAFCYDFAIEELEDWENRDSDASPKEIRANKRLADSYQSGKRAKALKRMSGKPFCNSLEEAVRNYRTEKGKEQKLLGLIREGMALITPESPNLTDYLYDWAYEEERDFYPVGMESQVMLVYSTDDTLAECMKGFMNSDYQETYALTPVTYRFLTPETDCITSLTLSTVGLTTFIRPSSSVVPILTE